MPDGLKGTPAVKPQETHRLDYIPATYLILRVDLRFELQPQSTIVTAKLQMRMNNWGRRCGDLRLDGRQLTLKRLLLDGVVLTEADYKIDSESLTINEVLVKKPELTDQFELEIVTEINPSSNTELEGLYLTNGYFCTQCEAEGFRKITYFLDRPDILALYRVEIIADLSAYPTLLSNGNCVERETLANGMHRVVWHDPFPKPSYLFALVAGNLAVLRDQFVTRSKRAVALEIYSEARDIAKCNYAMESLKKAMKWDEDVFGLEYDLDVFMIVTTHDFNMGAMENKGLNIFNSRYILADPATATDQDYRDIETVVAHEYFHNWTGNRVTCRDWFQLSLKEGLTVFRDQQFSADMGAAALKRISDVRTLRLGQFPEDSGPTSHPVRPDSYLEINNFYTATIYNKGAEVIRMIHSLLGESGFRKGMDLYIEQYDGQAATCDDFVVAMEEANEVDLGQFRRWYYQSGTPHVSIKRSYSEKSRCLDLTITQVTHPTPDQAEKIPLHIPITVALLDESGAMIPFSLDGAKPRPAQTEITLNLIEKKQKFRLKGVPNARVIPSLLRRFSAPVVLESDLTLAEKRFLFAHDQDAVNRWDMAQELFITAIEQSVKNAENDHSELILALRRVIENYLAGKEADTELLAMILTPPLETTLNERIKPADPILIHEARNSLTQSIGEQLMPLWQELYEALAANAALGIEAKAIAARSLRNLSLCYLVAADRQELAAAAVAQYRAISKSAQPNMTSRITALALVADSNAPERLAILADFADEFAANPLVLDKWFSVQARSCRQDCISEINGLLSHPAFSLLNPNRVRALLGTFSQGNQYRFHSADGSGYRLLAEQLLLIDKHNAKLSARLSAPLLPWRRYAPHYGDLMRSELEKIATHKDLSRDLYEMVSKSLV